MTTVPELRRLLEAKQEAGRRLREAFAAGLPIGSLRREYDRLWDVLETALTDDTLAAFVTALDAAEEALSKARPAANYGECIITHGALGIALAPLFPKEDNDA